MKRILITGANGYIGSTLYNALKDDYDVTAISRKDFDLTNNREVVDFFFYRYFDVVIHCAISGGGRLKEETIDVLDNNLKMYYNLLDCSNLYHRFINLGSGAEIYQKDKNLYGLSKHVIRKSILDKDNFYNIRIYGLFDENELDTRFIKANLKRYINREPLEIYENKFMDMFYMKDFIKLIKYYIDNYQVPKEIDCTYEKTKSLKQIAQFINNLNDYEVPINIHTQNGFYNGNYTNLGLNYIGLEEGIKEVYNKIK